MHTDRSKLTHYPHTFSGNRLDRAERERRDPDWIARRERDPASVFLPLRRLNVLVRETTAIRLDWRPGRWLAEMRIDGPRYLLGIAERRSPLRRGCLGPSRGA